jgi:hypothetical protein
MHIRLARSLAAPFKDIARASNRSVAAVIREALGDWLVRSQDAPRVERALSAVGGSHSGLGDLAEDHDAYLAAGEIVSVSEIARRAARPVSTIQTWRRRYASFPQPISRLAAGPVWDWDQVERWTRRHAAGETRRRRSRGGHHPWPADLPGADLVSTGLVDLASERESLEAALVSLASRRLHDLGVDLPAKPMRNAPDRLYELVEKEVGEAGAHSRYNALRRRLSSFMRALALTHAPAR